MAQPETQRNSQRNTARGKRRKNDPTHAVLRRIRAGKEVRAVDIGRIAEQVDQGVDDGALGASVTTLKAEYEPAHMRNMPT